MTSCPTYKDDCLGKLQFAVSTCVLPEAPHKSRAPDPKSHKDPYNKQQRGREPAPKRAPAYGDKRTHDAQASNGRLPGIATYPTTSTVALLANGRLRKREVPGGSRGRKTQIIPERP